VAPFCAYSAPGAGRQSLAFFHATKKRRLLHDDVSDEEAKKLRERFLAEPLAATITIPFAFGGPWPGNDRGSSIRLLWESLRKDKALHLLSSSIHSPIEREINLCPIFVFQSSPS
jgi:hypothetical protein